MKKKVVLVPADKSITHRALIFGAISRYPVSVFNPLICDDTLSTIRCLQALGVDVKPCGKGEFLVKRRGLAFSEPHEPLYAGNSGTTARLLCGLLAGQPFSSLITGDASLSKRPMNRVIDPLRRMGALITADNGHLPIFIEGTKLHPIDFETNIPSAQVKSALILASFFATPGTMTLSFPNCRDHTERLLRLAGVENDGETFSCAEEFVLQSITVPGDFSAAAFHIARAILTPDFDISIPSVGLNPTRTGFLTVLQKMGAQVKTINYRDENYYEPRGIVIAQYTPDLKPVDCSCNSYIIDEIPILAVVCAFADGTSIIRNCGELRHKESDRLEAIASELNKLSPGCAEILGDDLIIDGTLRKQFAKCKTYGDHRIAMALHVFGSVAKDVELDDTACVDISYPTFFSSYDKFF